MDRVIALVDMDCFYVQVEQRRNPELKGKPCAVVQYKTWKGGGIIAVGYEARAHGVTRNMRGDDAKEKCPDIMLVRVPENRGKADLTRYRDAGTEVIDVLCKFSKSVEKASVDEAYIDLTDEVYRRMEELKNEPVSMDMLPNTHIVGFDGTKEDDNGSEQNISAQDKRVAGLVQWLDNVDVNNRPLTIGAVIAEEMRAAVYKDTGFRCSAGISYNKMLAKLACGIHKPNQQTILPQSSVQKLFQTMPINKVRHFGGKLGQQLQDELGMQYMVDIGQFTLKQLQSHLGDKTGSWLYGVGQGIEHEPVRPRQLQKSIGCGKNFPGKTSLSTRQQVKHWLLQLAMEIEERLKKEEDVNKRSAKLMTVGVRLAGEPSPSASRSFRLHRVNAETICHDAFAVLQCFNAAGSHQAAWSPAILMLSLSASKFDNNSGSSTAKSGIDSFFTQSTSHGNDNICSNTQSSQQVRMNDSVCTNAQSTQQVITNDKIVLANKKKKKKSIESFFSKTPNSFGVNGNKDRTVQKHNAVHQSHSTGLDNKITLESGADNCASGSGFFAMKKKRKQDFELIMIENSDHSESEREMDVMISEVSDDPESEVDKQFQCRDEETLQKTTGIDRGASENVQISEKDAQLKTNVAFDHETQYPSTLPQQVHSRTSDTDVITCDKCSRIVSVWDVPEHHDYHFAMELQEQMNTIQSPSSNTNTAPSVSNISKKHGPSGKLARPAAKKNKVMNNSTLHSFFRRQDEKK
ncbi:DNA polymerase eta-like [Glandiceps talaboti]